MYSEGGTGAGCFIKYSGSNSDQKQRDILKTPWKLQIHMEVTKKISAVKVINVKNAYQEILF